MAKDPSKKSATKKTAIKAKKEVKPKHGKPRKLAMEATSTAADDLDACLKKHLPAEAQTLLQDFVRLIAKESTEGGFELAEPWATLYAATVAAKYNRDPVAVHDQLARSVSAFNKLLGEIELVPVF